MQNPTPKIDKRDTEKIAEEIRTLAPYYVPELDLSDDTGAGIALLKIFSRMQKLVIDRLNRVPHKNFVAFLDMIGMGLLPAQPARAPVTFYLAEGTTENAPIPEKTQIAAGAVVFETDANMVATPSKLKKAYSIDVANDRIYESPPGIVSGERAVAFGAKLLYDASIWDEEIFVDGNEGLNADDLLIIGKGERVDYGIVSEVSDSRVTLLHKLENGHDAGSLVEKVTSFELFKGKNLQEHTLYLGHKDLFNIKEASEIRIKTRFYSELADRDLVRWEYWGEDAEKNIGWHLLTIETPIQPADKAVNLKKDCAGEIKEQKIDGIESRWIRCRTIDGKIRKTESILLDTLQIGVGPGAGQVLQYRTSSPQAIRGIGETFGERLSKDGVGTIEELLEFKDSVGDLARILSGGREPSGYHERAENILENAEKRIVDKGFEEEMADGDAEVDAATQGIPPDLAFHNDAPMDLTTSNGQFATPIYPFGTAPRTYDTFYIASQEALSKKGSKIAIDVSVEPRGPGAPTTTTFQDRQTEKVKVFARGSYGRLVEVAIDPGGKEEPLWTDHGFPPDTTIALGSTPSIATGEDGFIAVFARAENGNLVERLYNGDQWQWIDLGSPGEGVDVKFDPAAVWLSKSFCVVVFVAGTDGHLHKWEQTLGQKVTTPWVDIGTAENAVRVDGSPFATSSGGVNAHLFVRGSDGHLHGWNSIDDCWDDNDYGLPSGRTVDSRPFAELFYNYDPNGVFDGHYAKVFIKDDEGVLWEFDTLSKDWGASLGIPSKKKNHEKEIRVSSGPDGYILNPEANREKEGKHIFVRGTDDRLWERTDSDDWIPHEAPANSELCHSPSALSAVHIFSASSKNSIIERKVIPESEHVWNEYKDPYETVLTPTLSWEYWNGKGWVALKGIIDGTTDLLKSGQITCDLPEDIDETEVSGQKSYWIRARIVGGDYGTETFFLSQIANDSDAQQLISTKNSIRPPIINSLTISYAIEAYPERCIAHNNLEYLDHSEACKSEGKRFSPFVGLEDDENALYLGFDRQLEKGPINIFFAAKELALTKEAKPKLGWKHGTMNGWTRLGCLDATKALVRADILKLIGSPDFSASSCLGSYLYWIKATLIEGGYEGKESPVLYGIYPNTAWASQEETVEDEILGSSDGTTDQEFEFAKIPVITAEIWVDEMATLSEDEKNAIIEEYGDDSVSEVKDETGKALEVWVLWQAVEDFFNSTQASRHYLVDRVTGKTRFGNGVHGMVPPVGADNIRATYQVGGGEAGNVPEFEITTLKTAIPYVDSVANPWSAGGGADVELLEDAMERGPWVIKHRDRAVTIEDFEWLARQASRDVARTKCMKEATGMEVGSVTVIILPRSGEDKPVPSFELENVVEKYLSERCSNVIALRVNGPVYIEVSVSLDVYPASIDMAAVAENETLDRLKSFLHPLTGGTDGGGWEFGRLVCTSDIYSLLEGIAEIDHVERVEARMFETGQKRRITVAPDANIPDALVCSGEHQVTIKLEGVA